MSSQRARRTAITGIGVVAPNGLHADTYWKNVKEGMSVLDRVTREGCEHLPLRVAGEVRGFDPSALIEETFLVQTDKFTHFALAAADAALKDARLSESAWADAPHSVGVVTAAGSGGGEFGQRELAKLWGQGPRFVGPYQSIAWFYAASTGQISIRKGFKGPCGVVASDEAGGLDAVAHAARAVRRGTDVVVVGAAEAPLAPYSGVCQLGYPELSTEADPARAYRPFSSAACGFVPAEGGAVLVVEDLDRARRRDTTVRATVAGHAATFTGASRWDRSQEGLAQAIRGALDEAGIDRRAAGRIDHHEQGDEGRQEQFDHLASGAGTSRTWTGVSLPSCISSTAKRRAPLGSTATFQVSVPSSDLPERWAGSNTGATGLPLGFGGARQPLKPGGQSPTLATIMSGASSGIGRASPMSTAHLYLPSR